MMHQLPRAIRPDGAKPRVLLVDDHQSVLNSVAALLSGDFDIAGMATGGSEALDRAKDLDPDAIVLDVNMPGFNGFQTMRALEQAGSRAPVVFLSMFESEEIVAEAFRSGGRGYVQKPFMPRELAAALDQVLEGRRFVPSLSSLFELTPSAGHAMHLHGAVHELVDDAAVFFDRALRRGDATCVIGTEDVRDGLAARLSARGWTISGPLANKLCLVIEAEEALNRFMRDGLPDESILSQVAAELDEYRRGVTNGTTSRLTIFGNMAALLLESGNPAGALALERDWERLTRDLPFFTVCYYPSKSFSGHGTDAWPHVCAAHAALSHTRDI